MFGEGISSNPLEIRGKRFAVFALSLDRIPVPREEWPDWVRDLAVPELDLELPATVEEALLQADELESMITPAGELRESSGTRETDRSSTNSTAVAPSR
ncbi:MAG: hypothetical protein GY925_18630 [Actinomycetia bacterium]|nr:hypothetical protein [Actinomycetes bacterium]